MTADYLAGVATGLALGMLAASVMLSRITHGSGKRFEACRWGDCDELVEVDFCDAHRPPVAPCLPSLGEACGDCHRCGRTRR